jgi:hypothetical protein
MSDTFTCESCGAEVDAVEAVRRLYVTPPQGDRLGEERLLEETELWCYPCRTHYPHVAA